MFFGNNSDNKGKPGLCEVIGKKMLVFDGAMGTMLQARGLKSGEIPEMMNTTAEEAVISVHRAYIEAGADVISTNSFGANSVKLAPHNLNAEQEVARAVALAKKAASEYKKQIFVAADIGPTGKLMSPLGDFEFEEAVNAFKDAVIGAEKAGADLIFFETFSDLYECKAAVIAARENTSLPVAVSLTFDESGRTLTGATPEVAAAYLTALGVDVLGVNCGLGPDIMEGIAIRLARASGKPIIVNANAGLPKIDENGKTYFDVLPQRFFDFAATLADNGIAAVGGCCGTTPEYKKKVALAISGKNCELKRQFKKITVCSGTSLYAFGEKTAVIGERLNPTGKKKLKEALKNNDLDYLCAEAVAQQQAGADILDVNVGIPEIDEIEMLPKVVLALQKVTDLPLQLDSANPQALEAAARIYNGIPIINSVNGKTENMNAVFPIVKKYGGLCVALLLDEDGIPDTAEGRLEIADRIEINAISFGISTERLLFDALTLTVATDNASGEKTLACVERISNRNKLTVLGVSNISFGMPNREAINASFLGAAMARGLSAAIINPSSVNMRLVLEQKNPPREFVYSTEEVTDSVQNASEKREITLFDAVFTGLSAKAKELATELLKTKAPLEIIESDLVPALDALGTAYEDKKIFLPRLLGGAEAAKSAFSAVNAAMSDNKSEKSEKFVIATVKGDIHDIGKNIVATLLSNYGFEVIDLGRDVPPQAVLNALKESGARLLGLSALMTTTVPAMAETVKIVKDALPYVKIIVGGAVLTEDYALSIGADYFGADAMATVKYAQSLN